MHADGEVNAPGTPQLSITAKMRLLIAPCLSVRLLAVTTRV